MLIGYRKFIVATLGMVSAVGLCAFGRLSGAEFVAFGTAILTIYGTSNVMANNARRAE